MSNKKRSRLLSVLILPLAALGILTLFFLAGVARSIPTRAEELFGPPDPDTSLPRLYYQSLILSWNAEKITRPADPSGGMITFHIEHGETPAQIIHGLQRSSLIDNPTLMRTYLVYSGLDKQIQAGEYRLSPAMSEVEIARRLRDPDPGKTTLTVIPGWRAEEIAQVFPEVGLTMPQKDFIQEVHGRKLEGYLFPDSYPVDRDITPPALVDRLYQSFQAHITPEIAQGMKQQGLSMEEGVILASIVEKEAVLAEEMPLIASVFLNRLRIDMPLGADPTIQYALGYNEDQQTWWTNPLSESDFTVESPYNTYQHRGLPPGPICNPGLTALKAVATPEQTPYYYFSAACDGSGGHQFSETFAEHQNNICP